MKLKSIFTLLVALAMSSVIIAQEKKYNPVDFSLQLKNMHLWRGYQVSSEALTAVDLSVKDKSNTFSAGVWGGAGFAGKFKEFDYYFKFKKSGFSVELWDIYNFSEGVSHNNTEVFNYKSKESGHFIDLSVGYTLQGNFPLSMNWATVIFGRDRGIKNSKNLYSSYVSLNYPVLRNNIVDLDLGVGGAFALSPEKGSDANFYSDDPNIVTVSLSASKKIQIGSYTLPVTVMSMWNPSNNNANIQIALDIF